MRQTQAFSTTSKQLEQIVLQGSNRGMHNIFHCVQGNLARAAASLVQHKHDKVVIIPGFFIPKATPPLPKTDGPIGAVHLAKIIHKFGKNVQFVAVEKCVDALRAAMIANDLSLTIHIVNDKNVVNSLCQQWQDKDQNPSHLISIERAGPNANDNVFNMRAVDIGQFTAPLHLFFEPSANKRPYKTIGIGDGGNEIVMGNIPKSEIDKNVNLGHLVQCQTSSDFLIISTVSNWEAGAFCLTKQNINSQLIVNYSPKAAHMMLKSLFPFAVDGVSGLPSHNTFDGITQHVTEATINNTVQTVSTI